MSRGGVTSADSVNCNNLSNDEVSYSEVVVFQEGCHGDCAFELVVEVLLFKSVTVIDHSHGGGHVRELGVQEVVALNGELVVCHSRASIILRSCPSEVDIATRLADLERDHSWFSSTVHREHG